MRVLLYFVILLLFVTTQTQAKSSNKENKIHRQIIAQTPLYINEKLTNYVDEIGQDIVRNSDQPNRQFHFFVLDDPGINAFTPGRGYIYIHRGILALMNSEAELAGVLAHEIGHNTKNHLGRTKSRQALSNVAAVAATVVTGSRSLGESISLVSRARISGFGRKMELEADEAAAQYLYNAEYDPAQMLQVLGLLKDQESFSKAHSSKKRATYHGVFSSHPRNDKRLQKAIKKAGSLPPGEARVGRSAFRKATTGMIFGENYSNNTPENEKRYSNKALKITFLYPKNCSLQLKGREIILKNTLKTTQLKIKVSKTKDKTLSSKKTLEKIYPNDLSKIKKINSKSKKDLGTIGWYKKQRVAVIKIGRNTFQFQCIAKTGQLTLQEETICVNVIRSFRRATRKDYPNPYQQKIYYEQLQPGERFIDIAKKQVAGKEKNTEATLRLINGYYPKGEPEPGTWIKRIRTEKWELK